jgi:hypothetical protein
MNRRLKNLARVPFAPVVAAMFGVITLILIFMTPGWLFERMIAASGLPALIPAASPPLGETARKLSAIAGGSGVFAVLWAALSLLRAVIKRNAPPKPRGSRITPVDVTVESIATERLRKRDPIFAERELGAPFMSDEAIAGASVAKTAEEPAVTAPAPVAMPEPAPLLLDRIAPARAETTSTLGGQLTRLESALERRGKRGLSTKPLAGGDITSLRNALRGLR